MGVKAAGVFLFVRWGFFVHSNPKLSHLQAVLPKYVDKHLFYDENSDFCFITLLWQLFLKTAKYLGTHNISGNTTNRRLPRSSSESNSPFFAYESSDLLCFLMPIKHPRRGKKGGTSKLLYFSYAFQPKACPFFWAFYSLGRSQQHYQLRESCCLRSCLTKLLNLLEPTDIREQTGAVSKDELQKKENKKHPLYTQALNAEFKNRQNKALWLIINCTTNLLKAIHSLYQSEGHIRDDMGIQSQRFKAHNSEYPPFWISSFLWSLDIHWLSAIRIHI